MCQALCPALRITSSPRSVTLRVGALPGSLGSRETGVTPLPKVAHHQEAEPDSACLDSGPRSQIRGPHHALFRVAKGVYMGKSPPGAGRPGELGNQVVFLLLDLSLATSSVFCSTRPCPTSGVSGPLPPKIHPPHSREPQLGFRCPTVFLGVCNVLATFVCQPLPQCLGLCGS